ncbi:hypothetical protein SFUMM280S_06370 [Streptomyces fumanus]
MAGTNTSEIRIAGAGRLFIAAPGTAIPETFTDADTAGDWGTDWKDLGYTSGDGVTFSKKDKLEPVDVWQVVSPVHFVYSDRDLTLKFSLLQFNEETLPFFMGGGSIAGAGGATSSGVYKSTSRTVRTPTPAPSACEVHRPVAQHEQAHDVPPRANMTARPGHRGRRTSG